MTEVWKNQTNDIYLIINIIVYMDPFLTTTIVSYNLQPHNFKKKKREKETIANGVNELR